MKTIVRREAGGRKEYAITEDGLWLEVMFDGRLIAEDGTVYWEKGDRALTYNENESVSCDRCGAELDPSPYDPKRLDVDGVPHCRDCGIVLLRVPGDPPAHDPLLNGAQDLSCPACTTENGPMGVLGSKLHYRCRDCGLGYSGDWV